jgi:hypothetical protein
MTRNFRRPNKRDLFIVGTAAALAFAPQAIAAEETHATTDAEALRAENAQLRDQLAAMQKKLDGLKKKSGKPAKTATQQKPEKNPSAEKNTPGEKNLSTEKDPFAMKELDPAYTNTGNAGQAQSAAKTAAQMTCGANMKFTMPEGSQFYYNPVFGGTDNMYHVHPEGMWMFNAKLMHMEMDGLQAGTTPIGATQVGPGFYPTSPYPQPKYPYMMIPTKMTMDMNMYMLMYGVTDKLTVMAMLNYNASNMNMFMDMGNLPAADAIPGVTPYHNILPYTSPMATAGIGDTEVDAIYQFYYDRTYGSLVGTLGMSFPTGSTTQNISMMAYTFRAPYDMQLGSGTFDLKPALTYSWVSPDVRWNLGAAVSGIIHTDTNNGWAFGNSFKVSSWVQYDLLKDFAAPIVTWYRMTFTDTGRIRGFDPQINCIQESCNPSNPLDVASMPDANPYNYGGKIITSYLGAYYRYSSFSIGLEGGVPVYQNLNGLQLKNTWQITGAAQVMF